MAKLIKGLENMTGQNDAAGSSGSAAGGYTGGRFTVRDMRGIKTQSTIMGLSNQYAKEAAERWGGSPKDYKAGPQGTLAVMQREGMAALQYVQTLQNNVQEYMDTYTWRNEPGKDSGGGWYVTGTENADKLGIKDDAQGIADAIKHKLAEGEARAMAIRIKVALEKMERGGARDVTDYIEWVMYASYTDGMRTGVDRTRKQQKLYMSIIETIRNA